LNLVEESKVFSMRFTRSHSQPQIIGAFCPPNRGLDGGLNDYPMSRLFPKRLFRRTARFHPRKCLVFLAICQRAYNCRKYFHHSDSEAFVTVL
jgi:hypothetical protein